MKYIQIFLISMLPLIELRGAIPYSQILGMPLFPSIVLAILGNILPVPFIFLFAKKILLWGKGKKYIGSIFTWILNKGEKGGRKLNNGSKGVLCALIIFVSVPLPGTGAWTGTLAASLLNIRFNKTMFCVLLGVIISGCIMGLGSSGIIKVFQIFV